MDALEEEIKTLNQAVIDYDDYLGRRILSSFPELVPILRKLRDLLASFDLSHLGDVPIQNLKAITAAVNEATSCIKDYMLKSFPPEDKVPRGGGEVRPQALVRNRENIRGWRSKLTVAYDELFNSIGPIVAQQQTRIVKAGLGVPLTVDRSRSTTINHVDDPIVWRYMPLRNLLRSEAARGVWMSSIRVLRTWSEGHIADTREGEIPPVVAQFKQDFEQASATGSEAVEAFARAHEFSREDIASLPRIIASLSLDIENAFVSSWVQRPTEKAHMWSLYGDSGSGVAIHTKLSKLLSHNWKVPLELGGITGPKIVSRLILREVQYLTFTQDDRLPGLNDLYLTFLKPDEFEAEHEVRLVAFITQTLARGGFTLIGNLAELIDEIVVGPHANLEETKAMIRLHAADLRDVQIRPSTLPR